MFKRRAIMLLVDGSRPDVMEALAKDGDLPNISKHFFENGSYWHGVTAFPSTTGPAYMPFLTGCLPATCNIPGIRWVDRSRFDRPFWTPRKHRSYVGIDTFRFNRDLDRSIKTAFETIDDSYSIFNMISRGAGRRNLTPISRIWYCYYAHLTDRWGFVDKAAHHKLLETVNNKDFQFIFTVFPAVDEYSHFSSPFSEVVKHSYRAIDRTIGELMTALDKQGLRDDTNVWIVSDHGLSETREHFCINQFLERRKIKTFYYPLVHRRHGAQAASMVSGNGMSHLYFRSDVGWGERQTVEKLTRRYPNMLEELLSQPAVDVLAMKNEEDHIVVRTKRGEAVISLADNMVTYSATCGDPLGYGALGTFVKATSREWLDKTIHTDYPDLPYQLSHLFTASRCGDVVISATPGYDLRLKYENPEHKASHGALHRDHMLIPVATTAKLNATCVRSIDVYPTILNDLGYTVPEICDGVIIPNR